MSMLRLSVLIAALLAMMAGLGLLIAGVTVLGLECAVCGALVSAGTVFERWRYEPPPPLGPVQPTGEVFFDPTSGERIEVLYDPQSGRRVYQQGEPAQLVGWQQTNEVFYDPTSGKRVEVQYNPESGRRRYLEQEPGERDPAQP